MADLLTVKSISNDFLVYPSNSYSESSCNIGTGVVVEDKNSDKEKDSTKKTNTGIKKYVGILCTLAASLFYSVVMVMAKMLGNSGFNPMAITFWRKLGVTSFSIPILFYYAYLRPKRSGGVSVFSTIWPPNENGKWKILILVIVRAFIGSTGLLFRFYALKYLTIADTSVISFSAPIVVTIMAHFCLGEKCGVIPIIVTVTTLAGVIFILRPPILTGTASFQADVVIGTAFGCLSMLGAACSTLLTRKLREVQFSIVVFSIGFVGLLESSILSQIFNGINFPSNLKETLCVITVAVLSFLGNSFTVLALKFEQAGPVALTRTSEIVFSFLLQFLCLGVIPDQYSEIGAVIVVSGVAVTAVRKWLMSLPDNDEKRQKCCILLL